MAAEEVGVVDEQPPAAPGLGSVGRERVVALVERVARGEARIAALHAEQISDLADLAVDPFVADHDLDLVVELAARLRWTSFTASRRLGTASRVAACFPLLLEDLAEGRLDQHRVQVVVSEADLLDEEQAQVLDAVVSGRLAGLTTAQIRALVRREIDVIDSDAVKERARRVVAQRRLELTALPDGAARLELHGPADAVRGVYERLDALARDTSRPGATTDPYARHPAVSDGARGGDTTTWTGGDPVDGPAGADPGGAPRAGAVPTEDTRGIDAKRFDAAVERLLSPVAGAPGAATGTGPQIHIALSSAIGLDDLPAHLSGGGPLSAEHVRHLLTHSGFRRVVVDPVAGHVVAVDGHTHPAGTLPDLSAAPPRPPASAHTAEARTGATTAPGVITAVRSTVAPCTPPPQAVPPRAPVTTRLVESEPPPEPERLGVAGPGPGWVEVPATRASRTGGDDLAPGGSLGHEGSGDDGGSSDHEESDAHQGPGDHGTAVTLAGLFGYDVGYDPATDDPDDADPLIGPRDPECVVMLDITRMRPATLVDPHLVHDPRAWAAHADRRTRRALASCPVVRSGDRAYRFSAALRRFLVLRAPQCTAPGCRAPAHRCDLDHVLDHALGGPTCACNAAPLCRRHHTVKHTRGWRVVRSSDDPTDPSATWLSPLGYLYTVRPAALLPQVPGAVRAHLTRRARARRALQAELASRPVIAPRRGGAAPAGRHPSHSPDHVWDRDCRECEPESTSGPLRLRHRGAARPDSARTGASGGGPAATRGTDPRPGVGEPPY